MQTCERKNKPRTLCEKVCDHDLEKSLLRGERDYFLVLF